MPAKETGAASYQDFHMPDGVNEKAATAVTAKRDSLCKVVVIIREASTFPKSKPLYNAMIDKKFTSTARMSAKSLYFQTFYFSVILGLLLACSPAPNLPSTPQPELLATKVIATPTAPQT